MLETDLYPPLKAFLEAQGYRVKGEVRDCDIVAVRDGEPPVIVELKKSFGLPLLYQGIRRLALTDHVYLAVPQPATTAGRQRWRREWRDVRRLCRRLGVGLIQVKPGGTSAQDVFVLFDPEPYRPRKDSRAATRLLKEFQNRIGDPTPGGGNKRPHVTAYRQDALRCAAHLRQTGPCGLAEIRATTGVARAGTILYRDVYGWFHRCARGVYDISPKGLEALATYADVVSSLEAAPSSG